MKKIAIVSLVAAALIAGFQIRAFILSDFQMEKKYLQKWELADKSSTIPAKQKFIQEFTELLRAGYANGEFASHNAIWLQTPNNSFEANLLALQTLSDRLTQIEGMNPGSFEYNTAIQQITSQEQGEAKAMIAVFDGCYALANFPLAWNWIALIVIVTWIISGLIGCVMFAEEFLF